MADLAARAAKPHINKCPTKLTIFYDCFRNSLKKYTCLFIGTKLVEKVEEEISEMIGKKSLGLRGGMRMRGRSDIRRSDVIFVYTECICISLLF